MGARLAKQVKDVLNRAQNDYGRQLNGGCNDIMDGCGRSKRYQQPKPTLSNVSEDSESTIDSHEEYQIHQGMVPQLE